MTYTSREAVDRLLHDATVRAALGELELQATSPLVPNWARRIIAWAAEARALLFELAEEREDAWLAAKIEAGDSNSWRARAKKAEAELETLRQGQVTPAGTAPEIEKLVAELRGFETAASGDHETGEWGYHPDICDEAADAIVAVHARAVKAEAELARLREANAKFQRDMCQALNEGDGAYRP